jgi:hypothetical protein
MDDGFFISIPVNAEKNICISQMTGDMAKEAGAPPNLAGGGFFVYESYAAAPVAEMTVLAKAASLETAIILAGLLVAASSQNGTGRLVDLYQAETISCAMLGL